MDDDTILMFTMYLYLLNLPRLIVFIYKVCSYVHYFMQMGIEFLFWKEEDGLNNSFTDSFGYAISEPGKSTPTIFKGGWLTVNGVSSHILTWGGWVEDPPPESDSVILFMCGVPGITLFYYNFLEKLYNSLKIPVWTICVAGHELPPSSSNMVLPGDPKLYNNVKAQVDHKMAFIKSYVPRNKKIYLIGHSFGAKMVTELLKDKQVSEQMQKCVLLMPTLERFKDTPRAQFWLMMLKVGFIYPLAFFVWVQSTLPMSLRIAISHLYFRLRGLHEVSQCCKDALLQFCEPTVFYNVRTLVWDELRVIQKLDTEILTRYSDKMKVYFAMEDQWAPLTHCETLKAAIPQLSVEVLDSKFKHAFTLDTAQDMAEKLVVDLVNNDFLKQDSCL